MAVLSDLPNEVFNLILLQIQPTELEAFLQISKTIRQNLQWLLREHYNLKPRLLKTILNQPRVANYVQKMDVEDWDRQSRESTSPFKFTIGDSELLSKTVIASMFVSPGMLEWLLNGMKTGDEEYILILLLTLLPNLKHISFVNYYHIDLGYAIYLIASEHPMQYLTQLETLHLQAHDAELPGYVDHPPMLPVFGSLPSMKRLSIHNASTCAFGYDRQERLTCYPPFLTVAMTNLTLSSCAIYSSVLCGFLARCTCLESFHYWPGDEPLDGGALETFNPAGIVEALRRQCTYTLESLTILSKTQPAVFMGSLQPFHMLEELTTDLSLLIGKPVIIDHTDFSTASSPALTKLSPSAHERLLSDTLPSDLVQLTLKVAEKPSHGDPETKRLERQIGLLVQIMEEDNLFHELEKIKIEWEDGSVSLDIATMLPSSDNAHESPCSILELGFLWLDPAVGDI